MDTQVTSLNRNEAIRPTARGMNSLIRHVAATCLAGLLAVVNVAAQVPEPETIFYGRIFNRTGGQEYQVTSGTLSWTIAGDAGQALMLTTELAPFSGGSFSYVLKVPHQARSYQLVVGNETLPLSPEERIFRAGNMTVNGRPAMLRSASEDGSFAASQPQRANVHRMDLEVFDLLADTDGDGMPDWWEDKYGLNKQWAGDASLRHGNNRFTYLQAYRLGLDPNLDDTAPQLLTLKVTVMQGGTTGLLLRTVTSATLPAQLIYRLSTLPQGGSIVLRNVRPDPRLPHRTLKVGDSFTQEAIDAGRLEFVQTDLAVKATTFHVSVSDGNTTHLPAEGDVAVTVYRPEATAGGGGERWLAEAGSARFSTESALSV